MLEALEFKVQNYSELYILASDLFWWIHIVNISAIPKLILNFIILLKPGFRRNYHLNSWCEQIHDVYFVDKKIGIISGNLGFQNSFFYPYFHIQHIERLIKRKSLSW